MRNVHDPSEDDIIPNAVVTMVCPTCQRGHQFMSVHEAAKAPEAVRQKLGIGTKK